MIIYLGTLTPATLPHLDLKILDGAGCLFYHGAFSRAWLSVQLPLEASQASTYSDLVELDRFIAVPDL